jgi:hypothetical protein
VLLFVLHKQYINVLLDFDPRTKENVKAVPINSKTRKLFGLAGFLLSNDVQRNAVSFTVTRNQSQKVTANRGILYGKTYP